jgi:(2Fe-2S) ferredoxin
MAKFKHHIFVCENSRPPSHPKGCCADCGGAEIRQLINDGIAMRNLTNVVRASRSGCIGQCHYGVCLVVYPDDVWYGNVKPDDVGEILDRHILKGEVVERIVIPDHLLTGRELPRADPAVPEADA